MNKSLGITESVSKLKTDLKNDLLSAGYITGIILGIIGFVLLILEVGTFYKIHEISKWPITKNGGIINDSYMETSSGSTTYSIVLISQSRGSLSYRTRASFNYVVNGKTYTSNKISYYEPWNSNPIEAKVQNDDLTKGNLVNVRINPGDPTEAYIYNFSYTLGMRFIISLILSVVGIYFIFKV